MKRLLAGALAALTLLLPRLADAAPRWRLFHTSPLPSSQTLVFGNKTAPGYGGASLNFSGTSVPLSISSQTPTANAFCLLDNTLVWCGAGGVTTYGGTRFITTPIVGTAAYHVTVRDANGDSSNVTINVEDNRYDVAPTPPSQTGNQLCPILVKGLFFGDQVVGRDGNYGVAGVTSSCLFLISTTRSSRFGGPNAPTEPHARDLSVGTMANPVSHVDLPEDSTNDGWIKIRAEHPGRAVLVGNFTWQHDRLPASNCADGSGVGGCAYHSWQGWVVTGSFVTNANSTNHREAWIEFENNDFAVPLSNFYTTSRSHDLYVHDNYLHGNPILTIYADDSQIIGNVVDNSAADAIRTGIYNSVYGSHRSKVWWNFVTNKRYSTGSNNHNDMMQSAYNASQEASQIYNKPGDYEGPSYVGNVFVRGNGTNTCRSKVAGAHTGNYDPVGRDADPYAVPSCVNGVSKDKGTQPDGQGIFLHDICSGCRFTEVVLNNIYVGIMPNGIDMDSAFTGSEMGYNTIIPNFYTPYNVNQGPPRLRVGGRSRSSTNPSIAVLIHDNLVGSATDPNGNFCSNPATCVVVCTTSACEPPPPIETNTVVAASSAALGNYVVSPSPGPALQTVEDVIAALAPLNGSVLHLNGRDVGAVNSYCNFATRTCNFPP